jgi:hypothetical protein
MKDEHVTSKKSYTLTLDPLSSTPIVARLKSSPDICTSPIAISFHKAKLFNRGNGYPHPTIFSSSAVVRLAHLPPPDG